ncbi:glutathione ABC transporter substrate-binding protein GsiB [Virgibacillus phasianinus]|uniref:Glutathione-binding protein GsiB n=1 Tax=Virgibacillus phasianinus TaxID=2017483 RepID=A0A220U2M7_9BACI|nr:glutathione ABC transporter substrate-binding protein [Virgibacillus phasianinus]ASK62327.1 glutathione ABC transporter substrate-binding protein GsiB [Virgibacillus phasianinus]
MLKKKGIYTLFAGLMILGLLLAGCSNESSGNESSQDAPAKKGNDLTVAVDANFISMDPHDTNDTLSGSAQRTMFQGLFGFGKDMEVVPVLAKDYKVNDDGTVYTFHLKEGITFHDGAPFNAEAVKVNIDRLANPDNHLKRHSLFAMVDSTEAVDEYTVKINLKKPFGAFINNLAHPAGRIISPKALKKYGDEVARNPVGTGPFKFKEWVPGDHLTVAKYDDYWEEDYPKVDKITFEPTPENGSRVAKLQTGAADFIYPVPPEQAKKIDGKNGIEVKAEPSIVVQYLAMNNRKEPFNDVKVRKAINLAINKEAFIKVVKSGFAKPLDSVIAPKTAFYSGQEVYKYNLEKAKQLLKEAGYADGFKTTVWGENNSTSMKGMQFIQQQLAEIGVEVEIVPMETGTMSEKIWSAKPNETELEMYYGGWSPSTGDADWGIRPLLGGKEAFPPQSYNTAYYSNDKVNELISKALLTADPKEREKYYAEMQKIIWDDAPWAFLSVDYTISGKKDYLKGVYLLPDGSLSTHDAKIEQ